MTTTTRRLTLTEFRTEPAVSLSSAERDALRRLAPGIRIEPTLGSDSRYELTPDQHIGVVCLPQVTIEIRPKVPMTSVLFLVSHACEAVSWLDRQPEFTNEPDLTEVLAIMLARLVEQTTRRGLLNGYRSHDESLPAPRGRIVFDEQVRRRFGAGPPVEVQHDVFTSDILENRILLAAICTLGRISYRSDMTRRELFRAERLFGGVTRQHFGPARVPEVLFTRLNGHYQSAVALATLVLRSSSLDLGTGGNRGSAFLVDMNAIFERFVRRALRAALGVGVASFPERPPLARLDEAGIVPLKPDLSLVKHGQVVWVGDAKYKRLPAGAYRNADLYQLLAYAVALDLPGGTLVYAADEGVRAAEHVVVRAGKRLRVVALDLFVPRAKIGQQIQALAREVAFFAAPAERDRRRLSSAQPLYL